MGLSRLIGPKQANRAQGLSRLIAPNPPKPQNPLFFLIFGAWGPQQGGAAAPGGGANLAKCPFLGKTSRENPKSKKWSKKEGSKTMLEMIAAKF